MAESPYASNEGTTNLSRANRLILGPCADQLRDVLRYYVPPSTFPQVLEEKLEHISLTPTQRNLILPSNGSYTGKYDDIDIILLYILLRHICDILPPKNGWGSYPDPTDRSVSANIERIPVSRNQCVHVSYPTLSNSDFNEVWSTVRSAVMDLDSFLGNGNKYVKEVDFLRHARMDPLPDQPKLNLSKETAEELDKAFKELEGSSTEVTGESVLENEKESIPPQYIEQLEASLNKGAITVQHSRGILVGCAEAGKTTLLKRLMGENQDVVEDIESTRGLELHHHVFNIKDGRLEVSGDDRQQKAFIRVSMSDLIPDLGKKDEILQADVNAAGIKIEEDNSDVQNDNLIENRILPTEVERDKELDTMANSVQSDAVTTTIPRDILLKILDEKEKVPTISMLDLAGQFAYYACHQIYITKRVFFILVLNVNQRFEDDVSTEEDNQEGSVFSKWTYKDYVKFWITSIRTFGSTEAQVLIIATHTEEKSEDNTAFTRPRQMAHSKFDQSGIISPPRHPISPLVFPRICFCLAFHLYCNWFVGF